MKEKFKTLLYKKVPFRNRTESFIADYTQYMCKEPLEMTIENLRCHLITVLKDYILTNKSHGKAFIHDICVFGSIHREPNIQERDFAIYGVGRKTPTLIIKETLFKDANKSFEVAKCVLNNNIY